MISSKRIASFLGATLLFSIPACSSQRLDEPAPETPEVVASVETQWVGQNFTSTETEVLEFLQEQGITDKGALATIMGNIKQESKFDTRICEGGLRTGYEHCHSGGFGLIQWTTPGRYQGLGRHAKQLGLCPNSLKAQLSWMVNEESGRRLNTCGRHQVNPSMDTCGPPRSGWVGVSMVLAPPMHISITTSLKEQPKYVRIYHE